MKFKTLNGMMAHDLGTPLAEDPGMAQREWRQWQNAILMDVAGAAADCIVGYNLVTEQGEIVDWFLHSEIDKVSELAGFGLYVQQVNKSDLL